MASPCAFPLNSISWLKTSSQFPARDLSSAFDSPYIFKWFSMIWCAETDKTHHVAIYILKKPLSLRILGNPVRKQEGSTSADMDPDTAGPPTQVSPTTVT